MFSNNNVTEGLLGANFVLLFFIAWHAAKETLRPADGTSVSITPKEADQECTAERPDHNSNWIPWIIVACLSEGSLAYVLRNMRLLASLASVAASPAPKVQDMPTAQSN